MRILVLAFTVITILAPSVFAAPRAKSGWTETDTLGHGGGCRKSSPPGQCCHMDNRVGKVHCH